ncbi:hypothetical protein VHUM_03052 [Vanrija humicola]|uniref:Uncharacterized protein n=1 Tax=Vanrija humicola TaxID=5417 RepID=A0A7D8V3U9_VANHU|nr:hypothetical protein VHUM_03052 [Vanrija humicola]
MLHGRGQAPAAHGLGARGLEWLTGWTCIKAVRRWRFSPHHLKQTKLAKWPPFTVSGSGASSGRRPTLSWCCRASLCALGGPHLPTLATAHFTGTLQQPEQLKTSQPFNDEIKVSLLHAERNFKGDVEGFSVAEYVSQLTHPSTHHADNPFDSTFAGQTIFDGAVFGKKGSFAAQATGKTVEGVIHVEWKIVPETATGELRGIRGHGGYSWNYAQHVYPDGLANTSDLDALANAAKPHVVETKWVFELPA